MATFDPNRYMRLLDHPEWSNFLLDLADAIENADTTKTLIGNYTIGDRDANTFFCDTTAGAFTVYLPYAANNKNRNLCFVKTDSNAVAVTLDGQGADLINGATTEARMDAQHDTITVASDGSNYYIVSEDIT